MAEKFRLDPEGLDAANGAFGVVGSKFSGAFDTLTGILDAHHGCWGTDDIGKAFETNYVQPSGEVIGYAKDAVGGFTDLHDGVKESRDTFTSVDQDNAEKIDKSTPTQ